METFNDHIDEQILNELFGSETLGHIKDNIARKIGAAPDALKAKLGSKVASGRLNLRNQVATLTDEFKSYCGEQHINFRDAAKDDFVEFLQIHDLLPDFPEEVLNKLVYGSEADADAPNAKAIEAATAYLKASLEASADIRQPLAALVGFARTSGGDKVKARKAIWHAARANPSQAKKFAGARGYVGNPIGGDFTQLVTKASQVILKKQREKGMSGSFGSAATATDANGRVNPEMLKVNEVEAFNIDDLGNLKTTYPPLIKQLAQYGVKLDDLSSVVTNVKRLNGPELERPAKSLDGQYKLNATINICRILLQCFRSRNGKYLNNFYEAYKGDDAFVSGLKQLLSSGVTMDKQGREVYNGNQFNAHLANSIKSDAVAAKMLVCILRSISPVLGL